MTATTMSRSRGKRIARRLTWWAVAALVIATPKCLLCVAGYLGVAAALGLGAPALCGAHPSGNMTPVTVAAAAGVVLIVAAGRHWSSRRARSSPNYLGETAPPTSNAQLPV